MRRGSRAGALRAGALLRVLALVQLGAACKRPSHDAHDHASEHPEGHDHHAENHGHGGEVQSLTRFSESLELFAEHAPIVAGEPVQMLLHVTVLEGFAPARGALELELSGPKSVRVESTAPSRPGIYGLSFTLPEPGTYQGRFTIEGAGSIEGVPFEARSPGKKPQQADRERPHERDHDHDHEPGAGEAHAAGTIEFLKEQQWGVPFATAAVTRGTLVASIEVAGAIDTPVGRIAEIGAPIAGRLVAPSSGLPQPGQHVKKGSLLALLAPLPTSPEEAARAGLAVAEAEARAATASAELERVRRLLADRAIAQREVENAQRELAVAKESVSAARAALALYSGASAGKGAGSWRVIAPIDGSVVSIDVTQGATVTAGQRLFRVVDPRELWIVARVPEQDAARLRADRDAAFRVAGLDAWQPIDVSEPEKNARIVNVGRTVDPVSRTVDVIYELSEPAEMLRVGGLLEVSLPVGEEFSGVVVPASAVLDHEGRDVVYVQLDAEHFAQRTVRVGPRAGSRAGIVHGLREGERIVTKSAHLVRLADRPKGGDAHGHIH